MIGELMIISGVAGLFGLSLLPSNNYRWKDKYSMNIGSVVSVINSILPSDIVLFFIKDEYDLQNAIERVKGHLYPGEIEHLKSGYDNFNLYGVTFKGSNAAFVMINNIIKQDTLRHINDVSREIYITAFHEMYHILFDTDNEDFVREKSTELYELHKDSLPSLFLSF